MSKISVFNWAFSLIIVLFGVSCKSDGGNSSATKLQGIYSYDLPDFGGNGVLKVSQLDDTNVRFSLTIVGGPPAHNQGMLEGTAQLRPNGKMDITTEGFGGKCHIEASFEGETAILKTLAGGSAACGFGNGIVADGTYKLTGKDAGFDAPSDTTSLAPATPASPPTNETPPASLDGNWISTSDPKSELKILGAKYAEVYEGKERSNLPFTFYMKCPVDCDPKGGFPCLKVIGQDDACYAVLRVDAVSLELSLIGGTGKTLAFKRKE